MSGRLRSGELLAGAGAVALLVALFLPWFALVPEVAQVVPRSGVDEITVSLPAGTIDASGWNALGWLTLAVAAAAVAAGLWLAFAVAAERPVTQQVGAAVLAATVGGFAFVLLALRVLAVQPGETAATNIRYGAWVGLAAAAVLVVGAFRALGDERTDLPENAYEPPPARPTPPARAS